MEYWVIRHPMKGWFIGFDSFGTKLEERPRFRWAISASDEATEKYNSPIAAKQAIEKVNRYENGHCVACKVTV